MENVVTGIPAIERGQSYRKCTLIKPTPIRMGLTGFDPLGPSIVTSQRVIY